MKIALYVFLTLLPFSPAYAQTDDPSHEVRTGPRYSNTLAVFNEPTIFPRANADSEVYRLLVTATFYHPLIVRIERNGTEYVLHAKWLSGQVGYNWGKLHGEKHRRLSQKECLVFNRLLNEAPFWTLAYEEKEPEPNDKGFVWTALTGF